MDVAASCIRLIGRDAVWTARIESSPSGGERKELASLGEELAQDLISLEPYMELVDGKINHAAYTVLRESEEGLARLAAVGVTPRDVADSVHMAVEFYSKNLAAELGSLHSKTEDLLSNLATQGDMGKKMWGTLSLIAGVACLSVAAVPFAAIIFGPVGIVFVAEGIQTFRPPGKTA